MIENPTRQAMVLTCSKNFYVNNSQFTSIKLPEDSGPLSSRPFTWSTSIPPPLMATRPLIAVASLSHRDPPHLRHQRTLALRRAAGHKMIQWSTRKESKLENAGSKRDGCASASALMLRYAENGLFTQAQALWGEIINSSLVPSLQVVSALVDAYVKMGQFDEVARILREIASREFSYYPKIYSFALSCFGKAGELGLMDGTLKDMASKGFKIDSTTGNAFVKYCSIFGSITEMEMAYQHLKKSRILIEKQAIRAMASAYITRGKYYELGEFLRSVGLGRRNVGNLLWNLLLLSYAANFKMKSLQREFLKMVDAGFSPDLTTFNIRALAFSRMSMFWDLHLSVKHMKHEGIVPDLVTYGCIVDAYLGRRLGKNLSFALDEMNAKSFPLVSTDLLVFEVFGKGDFHSSSEALLESSRQQEWTYAKLIAIYLKKQYRSNQIFWNY